MSKFYIVSRSFSPNTAEIIREINLIRGLSKMGVKATVVFITPDKKRSLFEDNILGISVKYLWSKKTPKGRFLGFFSMIISVGTFLLSLKKEDKVLLLGCHSLCPLVVRRVGSVYHERTEHPDVVPWPRGLSHKCYYNACKKLNGLFVISEPLRQFFISMGCDSQRIHISNMTVDPDRFNKLQKQNMDYKYIAYCGTAFNNKDGVDELIKAFAIVAKSHPEYKLYIIGKVLANSDKTGNLALIDKFSIKDKVVFTGMVSASAMPQLLKNADILALARPDSLQAQCGFPTKLGEYLLTENPVVVTKVGDIPKFLKDGESALLVEQRNPEEFANKLNWLIDHPVEAQEIGKRGKLVAMNNFNSEIEAKKIFNVVFS